eukprot:CAMPEP_0115127074 /NCGR_PEP_ID=MMETSP0227-20121206/50152_1 /TAXON_ID=89957 /ORGANISM="Polarella glacialis, Strain CCMP 1383" /LENGTH=271 /DNA_ID=CAMNT_0002531029 /DNA_START=41 /DNA_END=852 /DNA_ORIENTATION=-
MMSLLSRPVELEEMLLTGLRVSIDQKADGDSNVKRVLEHIQLISETEESKEFAAAIEAMKIKVRVKKIAFRDITARLCIHPSCDQHGPGYFQIKQIQLSDIGKQSPDGVQMSEVMEIIVRALVVTAIRTAPSQIGSRFMEGLGTSLLHSLDYAQMHYDVGDGLQRAGSELGMQLGLMGNRTQILGSLMAHSVEQLTPAMEQALDKAVRAANPKLEGRDEFKTKLEADTKAFTGRMADSLKKASEQLSHAEAFLGQNVSAGFSAMGRLFKDL